MLQTSIHGGGPYPINQSINQSINQLVLRGKNSNDHLEHHGSTVGHFIFPQLQSFNNNNNNNRICIARVCQMTSELGARRTVTVVLCS